MLNQLIIFVMFIGLIGTAVMLFLLVSLFILVLIDNEEN